MSGAVVVGDGQGAGQAVQVRDPVLVAASGGLDDTGDGGDAGPWPLIAVVCGLIAVAAVVRERRAARKERAGRT
jgi:hypothetical protein